MVTTWDSTRPRRKKIKDSAQLMCRETKADSFVLAGSSRVTIEDGTMVVFRAKLW